MIFGTLHRVLNDEPGASGSTPTDTPAPDAPVIDNTLPDFTPEPTAAPAATPAPAPADPMAAFDKLVDQTLKGDVPAAPAATPAPAASPAPTAAPKAGEPDLTPPEGMTERASARWKDLTERVKSLPDLERRASEAETQLGQVRQMVNASGLGPDEFTEMLQMGRLFKSGNPQDMQKALAQLDGLRTDIATRLGVDVPGADPLAAHPDLKAKVEALTLTKEDALELAKLRGKGAQADALTAEQQEVAQFKQTVQSAAATMEQTLARRANEPGHESKLKNIHAYFSDPAKLQQFVTTYEPKQWSAALTLMYDNMSVPVPAAPPPGPQPLRPTNTRSGAAVVNGPVTATSALEHAFGAAGL